MGRSSGSANTERHNAVGALSRQCATPHAYFAMLGLSAITSSNQSLLQAVPPQSSLHRISPRPVHLLPPSLILPSSHWQERPSGLDGLKPICISLHSPSWSLRICSISSIVQVHPLALLFVAALRLTRRRRTQFIRCVQRTRRTVDADWCANDLQVEATSQLNFASLPSGGVPLSGFPFVRPSASGRTVEEKGQATGAVQETRRQN
jgi:hypothetical protein